MTINLRDRLAGELDHAMTPVEDLKAGIIAKGQSRLRTRRIAMTSIAAIAVVGAATGPGTFLNGDDLDRNAVMDAAGMNAGAVEITTTDARADWDAMLASLFGSNLPVQFSGVSQSGGANSGRALQFLAAGPAGDVQLNAEVYIGATLPTPSCAQTAAQACRTVQLDNGWATVQRNVYTNRPGLPQASSIFATQDGVQAIVNVVETTPGQSQFAMADLIRLAGSDPLARAIEFATSHSDALTDYGVIRP